MQVSGQAAGDMILRFEADARVISSRYVVEVLVTEH
jgi:hypothetical protein